MRKPVFLELDEVLALHASRIGKYGGSLGVRDIGLLSSALEMPRARFGGEFLHPTLHEMAAAYLFHVVKNHPFLDGNKRAGLACALLFLARNGRWIEAPEDELADLVLRVADGSAGKAETAVFIQQHAVRY